jgi:predicted transporter
VATLAFIGSIQVLIGGVLRGIGLLLANFGGDYLKNAADWLFEQAKATVLALSPSSDWLQDVARLVMIFGIIFSVVVIASGFHYFYDWTVERRDRSGRGPRQRRLLRVEPPTGGPPSV